MAQADIKSLGWLRLTPFLLMRKRLLQTVKSFQQLEGTQPVCWQSDLALQSVLGWQSDLAQQSDMVRQSYLALQSEV